MGAITPGAMALDAQPLDSPLYCLDGVGDPAVIRGTGILVELQAYNTTIGTPVGLLAHAESYGGVSAGGTTGIDTTGANLLVLSFTGDLGNLPTATFTDSKGNAWTVLGTMQDSGNSADRLYYVNSQTPNVGAGHTVSWTNGAGTYATLQFMAFKSSIPWTLDKVQGASGVVSPLVGPTLIPAVVNELIITTAVASAPANLTTVDGGFTIIANRFTTFGVNYSTGSAYKIQQSTFPVTATWGITPEPANFAGIHVTAFIGLWVPLTTLYFGTDGYNDLSAPSYYQPRMLQALNFRRDIFSGNTTGGASRASYGEMRLANDDGGLDTLRSQYAFAGWPAKLLIGDLSGAYSTLETLISGKPQQAFFSYRDLSITLRDRLQDFAQPIQTHKYLGDNVLPLGVEGGIDMKDKPKPLLFGRVQNIAPLLVNSAKLIYQVTDGPMATISAVFDKGAQLTRGVDYVDLTDMTTNEPIAGQYRCYLTGGYFRLGALPAGTLTCDAAETAGPNDNIDADNSAAKVVSRIVKRPEDIGEGGLTDADINWGDVNLLHQANPAAVGIWFADQTTFDAAFDALMISIGGWYGFDRFGIFRMARQEIPLGVGVCAFRRFGPDVDAGVGDFDIVDVRFLPTNDPDRGVPTWQVTYNFGLNYTVQSPDDLAGIVGQDRKTFLGLQYRTATATNTAIKIPYPMAMTKTVTSLLLDPIAAQQEANRLLAIYSVQRDFVEIDTPMTSDLVATVDIGLQVFLVLPRFNYNAGRSMRITGIQYNPNSGMMTLALWG